MIICRLQGGLGNQMLQYACTRALSLYTGQDFWFDLSFLNNTPEGVTPRDPELNFFHTNFKEASPWRIARIVPQFTHTGNSFLIRKERKWYRFQNRLLNQKRITDKCAYIYDEDVFSDLTCRDYFLQGYFFSERYFSEFRDILLNDFTPKQLSDSACDYVSRIKNTPASCSIHIRRGDYLNANTINVHGLCSLDYYNEAIKLVLEKNPETVFFCFSDDLAWCERNLTHIQNVIFVSKKEDMLDFEDLILMSECTHNIIANSTFSWWGAWLNKHPEKIVIAPHRLMVNQADNMLDCYPKEWIKL